MFPNFFCREKLFYIGQGQLISLFGKREKILVVSDGAKKLQEGEEVYAQFVDVMQRDTLELRS